MNVWVSDTGVGLEGQDLARIFNPFEQVESSTSRKYQGTGLGLAITRKMVELHSGAIWAESGGTGKGNTFKLAIPLREALEVCNECQRGAAAANQGRPQYDGNLAVES